MSEEKAVRIRLEDAQGNVLADLLQGDKAPGGRAFYVRRMDSDKVYRAPNFVRESVRGRLLVWIESRWCTLDTDLIQSIELTDSKGGEPVVLTREKGSRLVWRDAAGEQVPKSRVHLFLRALSLVTIKDVQGPGRVQGDRLTIRLEQAGGLTWSGSLGLAEEGKDRAGSIVYGQDASASENFQLLLSPAASKTLQDRMGKLQR
ncbi:MAG: DUF4340 domain-containing protein [Planctomycetes bacterium]|nr:DUF4340 domain-containing protein [Planctomycetota bacterium]